MCVEVVSGLSMALMVTHLNPLMFVVLPELKGSGKIQAKNCGAAKFLFGNDIIIVLCLSLLRTAVHPSLFPFSTCTEQAIQSTILDFISWSSGASCYLCTGDDSRRFSGGF